MSTTKKTKYSRNNSSNNSDNDSSNNSDNDSGNDSDNNFNTGGRGDKVKKVKKVKKVISEKQLTKKDFKVCKVCKILTGEIYSDGDFIDITWEKTPIEVELNWVKNCNLDGDEGISSSNGKGWAGYDVDNDCYLGRNKNITENDVCMKIIEIVEKKTEKVKVVEDKKEKKEKKTEKKTEKVEKKNKVEETMSGCSFSITRGKNKGNPCGKYCKDSDYCSTHKKKIDSDKDSESDKESNSESIISKLQEILSGAESIEDALRVLNSDDTKTQLYNIISETKSISKPKSKSSYIFFSQHIRAIIKEEGNISGKNIMSEIGKRWKNLTDDEKKPFEKLAEKDKEKEKETKITKITTAFNLFRASKKQELQNKYPDMKPSDIQAEIRILWKNISNEEKEPFDTQVKEIKDKLKSEVKRQAKNEEGKREEDEENKGKNKGKGKGKSKRKSSLSNSSDSDSDKEDKEYKKDKEYKEDKISFCLKNRKIVKEQNPTFSVRQITEELSRLWEEKIKLEN